MNERPTTPPNGGMGINHSTRGMRNVERLFTDRGGAYGAANRLTEQYELTARALEPLLQELRTANMLAVMTATWPDGSPIFPSVCDDPEVREAWRKTVALRMRIQGEQ